MSYSDIITSVQDISSYLEETTELEDLSFEEVIIDLSTTDIDNANTTVPSASFFSF